MKKTAVVLLVLAFWVAETHSQKVSGKSNTGPLLFTVTKKVNTKNPGTSLSTSTVKYEMEFSEPSGNGSLEAKETGRLKVVITNSGRFPVRDIVVKLTPTKTPTGITYNDSTRVGDIPPSGTRYAIFYFTAPTGVLSQSLTFQVGVYESGGAVTDPQLLTFSTKSVGSSGK